MIGLNELWYANYPRSRFHIFNDNHEWLQMDKIGHFTSSYYIGFAEMKLMNWCGVKKMKSILIGGAAGLVFLTSVEYLDGRSAQWGASPGDVMANTLGYGFLVGQQLTWKEQRILLKFSMYPSSYAKYRPDLLGKNFVEQLLKDYNAQTYWLSLNMASFMKSHEKFPKWLNIAIGYGAEGMTGASINPEFDSKGIKNPLFPRYRQFYLSLDLDCTRIKTKSVILKTILNGIGFIKFPFPAIEYNNRQGMVFHPLYF